MNAQLNKARELEEDIRYDAAEVEKASVAAHQLSDRVSMADESGLATGLDPDHVAQVIRGARSLSVKAIVAKDQAKIASHLADEVDEHLLIYEVSASTGNSAMASAVKKVDSAMAGLDSAAKTVFAVLTLAKAELEMVTASFRALTK